MRELVNVYETGSARRATGRRGIPDLEKENIIPSGSVVRPSIRRRPEAGRPTGGCFRQSAS